MHPVPATPTACTKQPWHCSRHPQPARSSCSARGPAAVSCYPAKTKLPCTYKCRTYSPRLLDTPTSRMATLQLRLDPYRSYEASCEPTRRPSSQAYQPARRPRSCANLRTSFSSRMAMQSHDLCLPTRPKDPSLRTSPTVAMQVPHAYQKALQKPRPLCRPANRPCLRPTGPGSLQRAFPLT